eukprot:g6823.t1
MPRVGLLQAAALLPAWQVRATTGSAAPTARPEAEVIPATVTEKDIVWSKDSDEPTPAFMAMKFDLLTVKNTGGSDIHINMPGCPTGKTMVKAVQIQLDGEFTSEAKDSDGKLKIVDTCFKNFKTDKSTA